MQVFKQGRLEVRAVNFGRISLRKESALTALPTMLPTNDFKNLPKIEPRGR